MSRGERHVGAPQRRRWTAAELEVVARRDLTARQIAAMLGRTVSSVENKRADLSSESTRNYREWTETELELLARKDLSAKEVAARLNRTVGSVTNRRAHLSSWLPHKATEEHGTPAKYWQEQKAHKLGQGPPPCEECRAALAQYAAERLLAALAEGKLSHGKYHTFRAGCRCDDCRAANTTWNARKRREQAASADTATRYNYEWTGPELEVAAREDLTAREVATMLGRTIAAVNGKRKKLRTMPRDQWLAGKRAKLH